MYIVCYTVCKEEERHKERQQLRLGYGDQIRSDHAAKRLINNSILLLLLLTAHAFEISCTRIYAR